MVRDGPGFVMVRDAERSDASSRTMTPGPLTMTHCYLFSFLTYRVLRAAASRNAVEFCLINASFFLLLHLFNCFSLRNASPTSVKCSVWTSRTGRREKV